MKRLGRMHLICGFVCSGKTHFARKLEKETGGVRLSIDEWLIGVSGDRINLDDVLLTRIRILLVDLSIDIAKSGVDVILDFGFWRRSSRDAVRSRATSVDARSTLYWVRCSDRVAHERSRMRNRNPIAGGYLIDDEAFGNLRSKFECPDSDESFQVVDTS